MQAAYGGHLACLRFLHQQGSDLEARGEVRCGAVCLQSAGSQATPEPPPGLTWCIPGPQGGFTAAICAAAQGHVDCLRYLKDHGADLDAAKEVPCPAPCRAALGSRLERGGRETGLACTEAGQLVLRGQGALCVA